jgi:hypothetical protein
VGLLSSKAQSIPLSAQKDILEKIIKIERQLGFIYFWTNVVVISAIVYGVREYLL